MPRNNPATIKVTWTEEDDQEFRRLQSKYDNEGLTDDEDLVANQLFERYVAHWYQTDPVFREAKNTFLQGLDIVSKVDKFLSLQERNALIRPLIMEAFMKIHSRGSHA
ncbi:hypothetical protein GURASL_04950 [Geotalea uraniireducens]|uniref:Uncharacterized protein n=1 Tax=Geotalea uraniireducens TaxID=351604 RepID=A0ABM8EHY2_9BACT|nr:hypothetical protein [Geotalea uraniireducens]BDV41572.1 hypothetical protein GURASL_04950 [Geotalea uraniireducens]